MRAALLAIDRNRRRLGRWLWMTGPDGAGHPIEAVLAGFPARLALAGLALGALAVLVGAGWTALLAWTDPLIPGWRYPWLLGGLLALYVAARFAGGGRRAVLLAGSLAGLLWFDLRLTGLALGFFLAFYAVVFAPIHRHLKLGFLIAVYAALMVASDLLWFPVELTDHPWVLTLTYAFAVSFTFRIFYFFHEMKLRKFVRVRLDDFLLYFLFAPYWIIVPYMFAIPRFGDFARGLARRDDKVEASGVRHLLAGAAIIAITHLALSAFSPRDQLMAHLRAEEWTAAVGVGLLYYPIQVVFEAIGVAFALTGMVQLLGIAMKPAFSRPLGATSIHEWWRRWNVHFRDFLVDVFFYPLMLRWRKRNPYLTIVVGCASVFLLGSTLFHWIGKYWFLVASHDNVYASIGVENALMFAAVAAGLCLEKRRMLKNGGRPPPRPPRLTDDGVTTGAWLRGRAGAAAGLAGTWAFLLVVVVFAGYGATYAAYYRPVERIEPVYQQAQALADGGDRAAAAATIAPVLPTLETQVRRLPREPVRRLELAWARSLPPPAGDPAAVNRHLEIARVFGDLHDPRQLALWEAIERLRTSAAPGPQTAVDRAPAGR